MVLIFASVFSLKAQQYVAEAFQDIYIDLEDYNSVLLESNGDWLWERTFELDFDFPYYDTTYDHINCFYEGACYFDGTGIYTLLLASFGYEMDRPESMMDLDSDVRYSLTERDGKKCFVLQLTKLRMLSDPSVEEFDSHIDMQYWFYEDGTIEIRFGHSNLDNSPTYVPGDGFYLISRDGPVAVGNVIRLSNHPDDTEFISYGDSSSYEHYFYSYTDQWLSIDWWPPEGWVIRFTRTGVNNEEVVTEDQWRVYAQNEQIVLDRTEAAMSMSADFRLYNNLGQPVAQVEMPPGIKQHSLDIGPLPQGIYFYELKSEEGVYQSGRLFVGE